MSAIRDEAILLRAVDFGESDRIVHFLTRERGRLTAIAKGARRSRRRFPGTLDVFNRLAIEGRMKPRATMAFLEKAELVDPYLGLREDSARYAIASFLMEMLDRLSPEGALDGSAGRGDTARGVIGSDAARLFAFAVESLDLLAGAQPTRGLRVLLELRALDALGLRPELGRCVRCGRVPGEDVDRAHRVSFYAPDGGIVCTPCSRGLDGLVAVRLGTARCLEAGLAAEIEALDRFEISAEALVEAERLVFRFQRFHVGVELRSLQFLAEVLPSGDRLPASS